MTTLDNIMGTPAASDTEAARRRARAKARDAARDCPWLAAVLVHHVAIEQAFAGVRAATDASGRRAAQRWLSTLVTGHAIAEEVVLYPAMAAAGQRMHSMLAFNEHNGAKCDLAALETLEPMSRDFIDKLNQLQLENEQHMLAEEGHWFRALARQGAAHEQRRLSARFEEEFNRYMGVDADLS